MIRLVLFFLVLSLAAAFDIKNRFIPDKLSIMLVGVSLIPSEPVYVTGLGVALVLLLVGVTVGGIGGGDIKLTGASGLVLGFERTFIGLFIGLCLLLIFHVIRQCIAKTENSHEEREQAYPLVPFLLFGMLIGVWIGG